jgi:hypothetical protein
MTRHRKKNDRNNKAENPIIRLYSERLKSILVGKIIETHIADSEKIRIRKINNE